MTNFQPILFLYIWMHERSSNWSKVWLKPTKTNQLLFYIVFFKSISKIVLSCWFAVHSCRVFSSLFFFLSFFHFDTNHTWFFFYLLLFLFIPDRFILDFVCFFPFDVLIASQNDVFVFILYFTLIQAHVASDAYTNTKNGSTWNATKLK